MPYAIGMGADAEPLVKDERLERVFYKLQSYRAFPSGTEFATFIQEPNDKESRRLAVFLVTSPHPRANARALTTEKLVTVSAMPYERWLQMEKDHRHYAGFTDPLRPVFAGMVRRHLAHFKNLSELI